MSPTSDPDADFQWNEQLEREIAAIEQRYFRGEENWNVGGAVAEHVQSGVGQVTPGSSHTSLAGSGREADM